MITRRDFLKAVSYTHLTANSAIKEKYLDDFKAAMDTDDKNVRDAALLPIMDKIAEEYPDLTDADLDLVSYKMQKLSLIHI